MCVVAGLARMSRFYCGFGSSRLPRLQAMPGKKRNYAEVMLDVYDIDPDTYHKRTKSFPMFMVASRKPVVIGIVKLGRSHIKAWKIRLKGARGQRKA